MKPLFSKKFVASLPTYAEMVRDNKTGWCKPPSFSDLLRKEQDQPPAANAPHDEEKK